MNSTKSVEPWKDGADRKIWAIAGPAIIANSSAPLVGLVDTWMVGHLPSSIHLAAIGVGATIFSYVFWTFGFLRMGTTGFAAQAHGRRDTVGLTQLMVRVSLTSLVIALAVIILQGLLFSAAVQIIEPPEAIIAPLSDYFDIRIWAAPATLFFYGVNGFLIGIARAKTALWLHLILNISNGLLNLVFVLGFDMGVAGIALGTLIAEWLTALVAGIILVKYLGAPLIVDAIKERSTWAIRQVFALLKVNGLLLCRTLLLITALAMIMREASQMGADEVAASQIANVFLMLIALGLDGFAYAGEALAGAAWGAGNKAEFRFQVIRTSIWAAVASLMYATIFWLGGDFIIASLTNLEDVRSVAEQIIPVMVLIPLIAFPCYQFDGIFIGATAAGLMLSTMLISVVIYIMILSPLSDAFGITGLWLAVAIFMGLRGLFQLVCYPWLERRLPEP